MAFVHLEAEATLKVMVAGFEVKVSMGGYLSAADRYVDWSVSDQQAPRAEMVNSTRTKKKRISD